jgi:hypothetical protein
MKMVKSLLLVSAAGVVAAPGAQAADLPVKAKPVEYVKICSLYGAGFYYIPGTDICMKIGGYVRYQITANPGNSISGGPLNGAGGRDTRTDRQDWAHRTRAHATFDTRQQTPYGTLRTYLLLGFSQDSTIAPTTAPPVYMTRGFMQIAGFTFGKATSFFDFVSTAAVAYNAGFLHSPDTGDAGQMVAAYTAQLGNGISATISAEQTRRGATTYAGAGAFTTTFVLGALPAANDLAGIPTNAGGAGSAQGVGLMDFVGNIRIDQAWGSAQVSVAAHNVEAGYYYQGLVASSINERNGTPGDKWGWAGSVGLRINTPMIAAGNYFQGAFHYCEGAIKYCAGASPTSNSYLSFQGSTLGYGFWTDAVFGGTAAGGGPFGNSIELTTAWSIMASYEHFWTPNFRTSVYGSYVDVSHNANARGLICSTANDGSATTTAFPWANQADATCNPDFNTWNVGVRTQWDIVRGLYVGVDVIYLRLNTARLNAANLVALTAASAGGGKAAGVYTIQDQETWAATWRIHRDVVP